MAAEAVGNLYAWLGLNTAGFDSGLASAQRKLGEFGKLRVGDGLKAAFGEVENALSGMAGSAGAAGSILSGLGITGVAAAAALGVAFQGARQAMAFGDEIGDTAAKLQVTTDYLQEMRFAAHGLGGDFSDADDALESFTKTFGQATSGLSSKAMKPFEALGLDPKSFGSVEEALNATIDKIAALRSVAEQAAVADKLGLTPMLPAIREGTAAIDEMRAEAQRLGYVMESELIEKAGTANDQYEALTAILGVQYRTAMTNAIPLVMSLTEMMVDGAKAAGELAERLEDVAGGLKASFDMAPAWAREARSKAIGANPLSIGFGNLGKIMDRAALRGRTVEASSLSDWLGSGSASTKKAPESPLTGELRNLLEEQDRASEAKRKLDAATRAAAAAEREHAAAMKVLSDAMHQTEQRSADYAASLLEEISTMGMSSQQLKVREMRLEAAAAPTQALADHINHLADRYEAQVEVGVEAAEIQKLVNDQQQDSIRTFKEATGGIFHFSTALEIAADDLGEAAWMARDLAYDIDDIARAINDNDWTSAFAGLANVLAKVEKAFANAKDAKDKYAAVAMLAQGVGGAVGGTGGAVVGGAGSGALAGLGLASSLTTLGLAIPGPGWALAAGGAVLGALGGLFGSSKAKKQAKAQAAAEAAAKEAQRQQQIADTRLALEIDLLRAQGKEQEAVNLERKAELDALAKLDASLVAQKQALYDAIDASAAKAAADEAAAEAAERAATIQAKAQTIQDRIDALTMTDAELLAKAHAKERAELVALDPTLGQLIDRLFGLEDAANATAQAVANAEAEAAAWAVAFNDNIAQTLKLGEADAERAAQAQLALSEVLTGVANAADTAAHALDDTIKSLTDFANGLKSELGVSVGGNGLDVAARAFDRAVSAGDFASIASLGQAYADAARENAASEAQYRQIIASIQAATMGAASAAQVQQYRAGISAQLQGAYALGDAAMLDRLRQQLSAPPAFATPSLTGGLGAAATATSANDNGVRALASAMTRMDARLESIERNTRSQADVLSGAASGNLTLSVGS